MNKLIAPLLLILLFATTSCSDDAKKAIQNIAPQGEETLGDISNNRTILDPKLGNFCEKHECPDGIVAVKTEKKKLTCSGIAKSQTEVLISNNCASSVENFNVQTTDGKLIKVKSVEEELTNEFGDKVLKLNLEEKISTTANINIPELEDKKVQLNYFNDLGELQTQNCELTYASLAYANSFDNESQLLNIKNCEGVRDGALISQNGKTIGFLTKKHDEIELYEGISLGGSKDSYSLIQKVDEISIYSYSDEILVYSVLIQEFPAYEVNNTIQDVLIADDAQSIVLKTRCLTAKVKEIFTDSKYTLVFNNSILELNDDTTLKIENIRSIIPKKYIHKLIFDLDAIMVDSDFYIYNGNLVNALSMDFTEYIGNGDKPTLGNYDPKDYIEFKKYIYSGENEEFKAFETYKCH